MENNKLFCYGILQRGHELDLNNYNARFLGEAYIEGATLYGIGPIGGGEFHGVGLRLNEPGNVACGELWEIPDDLWQWLDGIEQNGRVYTRKIVPVHLWDEQEAVDKVVDAWVYVHMYSGFKYENRIKGGRF